MISPKAKKYLLKSDAKMSKLVRTLKLEPRDLRENYFRSLVGSIVAQQLSTKAATTIYKRLCELLGSKSFTHKHILTKTTRQLRSVGLSGSKVEFVRGLAQAMDKKILDFRKIHMLTDEQVIAQLVAHKGIGRWTAEMFLIFSLGRPDVFSHGDGGLKNAIIKIYKPKNPDIKTITKITDKWRPYRSAASLYLWASLDNQ